MSEFLTSPESSRVVTAAREAASYIAAGDGKSAVLLLSEALRACPDAPDLLYLLGAAKANTGAPAEAEILYRRALAARPGEAHFATELGRLLRAQGRAEEAIAAFDMALQKDTGDARLLLHRGNALADLGRHEEALAAFSQAVGVAPDIAEAWTNRAATLTSLARAPEALSDYERALAVRPGFLPALNGRGVALLALRRCDEALAEFDKVLAASPDDPQAANNRALALQSLGRNDEAIRTLDALLARVPSYAEGWSNRGVVLHRQGYGETAVASFDRAIAIAPGRSDVWNQRAVALQALHRLDEARQSLETAISLSPFSAGPWRNLGLVLCESGDSEGAMAAFRRHAEIVPPSAEQSAHKQRHDAERRDYLAATLHRNISDLGARLEGRAINPQPPERLATKVWLESRPQIVVIDDFLTTEALLALRSLCLEGDVWHRTYDKGYLGAMPEAGFACPLLAQVAGEMSKTYPEIFAEAPLRYFWAFKYDSQLSGTALHADQAAVNVNFWITPNDANRDPDSGGLVIWDRAAPSDWDFDRFNSDPAACMAFLEGSGAVKQVVPHRCNRAVIFDSDLFHATDLIRFREGYENRRINLTFLFGRRTAD